MVFGMIPSKYIGGSNLMLNGMGLYGGGANLSGLYGSHGNGLYGGSFSQGGRINYYTGKPVGVSVASTVQPNIPAAAPNGVQNQNNNQIQNNNVNVQTQDNFTPTSPDAKLLNMQLILENTKNEQGTIGKFFDGIKGFTGLGLSSKKCQKLIDAAKMGQLPVDTAYDKVSRFSIKQKTAVNAFSGILASALAIFAASKGSQKGINVKNLLAAAGVGASVKAGIKTFDRATNNVKSDALDAKLIVKDGLSGAINGSATYALTGINKGSTLVGKSMGASIGNGAINGLKLGAASGAVMGASDYSLDCAFDENQKFNPSDFMRATVYSATAGGLTGAVVGGITGGVMYKKTNPVPAQNQPAQAQPQPQPAQAQPQQPQQQPGQPQQSGQPRQSGQPQQPQTQQTQATETPTQTQTEVQTEITESSIHEQTPKTKLRKGDGTKYKSKKGQPIFSKKAGQNLPEEAITVQSEAEAQVQHNPPQTENVHTEAERPEIIQATNQPVSEAEVSDSAVPNNKILNFEEESRRISGKTSDTGDINTSDVVEQQLPSAEDCTGQDVPPKEGIENNVSNVYNRFSGSENNGQNISDNVAGIYNAVQDKTTLNHGSMASRIASFFKRK